MNSRQLITIALVLSMALSGCAGWGQDGPSDQDDEQNDTTDDLENASNESENETNDTNTTQSESDATESDDGGDSDSTSDGSDSDSSSSDSAESTSSGSDSANSQSDESATPSSDGEPQGSDGDDAPPQEDGSDAPDEPGESPEQEPESDQEPEQEPTENEPEPEEPAPEPNESEPGPEAETHTLTVQTGEAVPVPGIDITLERHSDGATTTRTTGEDGSVQFSVIDGTYTVSGTDPNGDTDTLEITVNGSDEEVVLTGLAPEEPDIMAVSMTVRDAETGAPIEGAKLEGVGNYHPNTGDQHISLTTGADGTAQGEAYEGGYESVLRADGYEDRSVSVAVDGETQLEYELEPERQMHELALTVTVVDENGDPVSGELVEWGAPTEPPAESAETDENGEVVIEGQSSDASDAVQVDVVVDGESYPGHLDADGETLEVVVPQGTEAPNESVETNETVAA